MFEKSVADADALVGRLVTSAGLDIRVSAVSKAPDPGMFLWPCYGVLWGFGLHFVACHNYAFPGSR